MSGNIDCSLKAFRLKSWDFGYTGPTYRRKTLYTEPNLEATVQVIGKVGQTDLGFNNILKTFF